MWTPPSRQAVSEDLALNGEQEVRDLLNSLTIERGRAVLMAKKEEYERVRPNLEWAHEPIYGTAYHVERFDPKFVAQVRTYAGFLSPSNVYWQIRHKDRTIFLSCSSQDQTNLFLRTLM